MAHDLFHTSRNHPENQHFQMCRKHKSNIHQLHQQPPPSLAHWEKASSVLVRMSKGLAPEQWHLLLLRPEEKRQTVAGAAEQAIPSIASAALL
jgi:hypothetical protein